MGDTREFIERVTPESKLGKGAMVVAWLLTVLTTDYESTGEFVGGALTGLVLVALLYLGVRKVYSVASSAATKGKQKVSG